MPVSRTNVKVEQINTNKIGKKMSPPRSVPKIAVQVVEDVGEKTFTTVNGVISKRLIYIGFSHDLKRSESNLA